jgi:hypothetical protein
MRKVLMACLILMSAGIVSAQDFRLKFIAKTPFAIGNGSLPAGSYEIRSLDMDSNLFECAASSGSPSVLFEADPLETTPTKTDVTFMKYGDKMVLKNMSVEGEQAFWIPVSLPEKHHKKGAVKPSKVSSPAAKS